MMMRVTNDILDDDRAPAGVLENDQNKYFSIRTGRIQISLQLLINVAMETVVVVFSCKNAATS